VREGGGVRIWSKSGGAVQKTRYQTSVDSEDDWELVVLNLVRRPSGIAEDCAPWGGSGTEPGLGRERYLYYARDTVPGQATGWTKNRSLLLWHTSDTKHLPLDIGGNRPAIAALLSGHSSRSTNSDDRYLASKMEKHVLSNVGCRIK